MKLDCFVIFIFSATFAILTLVPVYSSWPVENGVLSCPSQNSLVTSPKKRDFDKDRNMHGTSSTSYQPSPLPPPNPSTESVYPPPPPPPQPGHLESNTPNSKSDNTKKVIAEDSSSQTPQSSQDVIDEQSLEQEEETIHRVIVVLASLGASLFLVAVAIAVLYCQVRKQQRINKQNATLIKNSEKLSKGLDPKNTEDDNDVINGTANASDMTEGSENDITPPMPERQSCPPRVYHKTEEGPSQFFSPKQMQHFPIRATAPPAEFFADEDQDDGELSYSVPPISAPPAYTPTPTAPPIHSLPYSPILDYGEVSMRDVILHDNHGIHSRTILTRMEVILPLSVDPPIPSDTRTSTLTSHSSDTRTSTLTSHSSDVVSTTEEQSGTPQSTLPITSAHHHHHDSSVI